MQIAEGGGGGGGGRGGEEEKPTKKPTHLVEATNIKWASKTSIVHWEFLLLCSLH